MARQKRVERIWGRGKRSSRRCSARLVAVVNFLLAQRAQRTQRRSGGFFAGLNGEMRAISGRRRQFRDSFVRSGGVFLVYEFDDVLGGGAGEEDFGDAGLF